MREVFIVSDNIVSPLGNTSAENFGNLEKGISGIRYKMIWRYQINPFMPHYLKTAIIPCEKQFIYKI